MASAALQGDTYFTVVLDEPTLGLKFNGEEITSLTKNGWAARNGVHIDDEIAEVNGQDFKTLTHQQKISLLVEGKRPLNVKFKRPVFKDIYFECTLEDRKIGMTMKGKYVKTVDEKGWAGRNNVMVGDEIAELADQGYAGLTDEERLKIFSGPRPLTIKFVRRNQKATSAIAKEHGHAAVAVHHNVAANIASKHVKGIDPTNATSAQQLADAAKMEQIKVAASNPLCFCCQSSADKTGELRVQG